MHHSEVRSDVSITSSFASNNNVYSGTCICELHYLCTVASSGHYCEYFCMFLS